MRNRIAVWVLVSLGLLACLAAGSCLLDHLRRPRVTLLRSPEADIIRVNSEYALILPSTRLMERAFGSRWREASIFYGFNRALAPNGERVAVDGGPYRPLAKGHPVMQVSGDDWTDLSLYLIALEPSRETTLDVNLRAGSVALREVQPHRPKASRVDAEGRLILWY